MRHPEALELGERHGLGVVLVHPLEDLLKAIARPVLLTDRARYAQQVGYSLVVAAGLDHLDARERPVIVLVEQSKDLLDTRKLIHLNF